MLACRGSFYPGTSGDPRLVGEGAGRGFNVNIGWDQANIGDTEYLIAFERVVLPIAQAFDPGLIIVSAGFDAAKGDHLGRWVPPSLVLLGFAMMGFCHGHEAVRKGALWGFCHGGVLPWV